jgi:hypothetical protein
MVILFKTYFEFEVDTVQYLINHFLKLTFKGMITNRKITSSIDQPSMHGLKSWKLSPWVSIPWLPSVDMKSKLSLGSITLCRGYTCKVTVSYFLLHVVCLGPCFSPWPARYAYTSPP